MACDITTGRVEPCKDAVGGLKNVYLINYDDLTQSAVTYDATNTDVIELLDGTPSNVNSYKFELKGANSYEQTINSSRENGTTFFEGVMSLTLKKQDLATHKQVKLLAFGRPIIVLEDNNGNFQVAGLEWGAEITGGTITSGAAMGDLNGYTLTFTTQERLPANFMEATNEAGLNTAGLIVNA
tara:strand:- start:456 stop:1004 length:549 start_codon:yes stop_codon:yes gene_type:complete